MFLYVYRSFPILRTMIKLIIKSDILIILVMLNDNLILNGTGILFTISCSAPNGQTHPQNNFDPIIDSPLMNINNVNFLVEIILPVSRDVMASTTERMGLG
ncbi:MAG: hypothetical protein C00003105_00082 [ANME-2 cluster archaeon HR1]|nr:MAG: hypothetical protein C00003105_00082 [ANME-2 cluster archaeon HR1]